MVIFLREKNNNKKQKKKKTLNYWDEWMNV